MSWDYPDKYPGAWYQVGEFQIHLIVALTQPQLNYKTPKNGDATRTSPVLTWTLSRTNSFTTLAPNERLR